MWKRLQGWKAKKISRAGKTVLIKNVTTAIPSYCMSSFLLPKSMCNEMKVMMNKYWWQSGSSDRKGINWVGWNGLSMSKCHGGLVFRSLYGYNIALMAKHVWKFVHKSQSLVSRFFKAKYFSTSHVLQAKALPGSSFIWQGIVTAKNEVMQGYRWVLGGGESIKCTQDPWLQGKSDFKVDQSRMYVDNSMVVSQLFLQNERGWDAAKVMYLFSREDADIILATRIPEYSSQDHLAWNKTTNGKYSVKTGYQMWHDRNVGIGSVLQSKGWSRLWKLDLPHKIKIFLWRFCRNNIPVKSRLNSKGVQLPLNCPMCNSDIEDFLHVFFECPFASACWTFSSKCYDLSNSENATSLLLAKLDTGSTDEVMLIVKVLWGVWFFRNQKVWESKVVNAAVTMGWSAKTISEWREARDKCPSSSTNISTAKTPAIIKWQKPEVCIFKLNVDAAMKLGDTTFTMGLVLRDHVGALVLGKTMCKVMVSSVFEAEALAVLKGLQWFLTLTYDTIVIESDSFLTVRSLHYPGDNMLEVGNILNTCRTILDSRPGFSVSFVKRQANEVAHLVAKFPCSINCQNVFTSPSNLLLESLTFLSNDICLLFKKRRSISLSNNG